MSAFEILVDRGGFAAYLIFVAGALLAIIGVERVVTLFFRMSFNVKGSVATIRSLILDKKYTDAIQVCNKNPTAPELSTISAGLTAVESGREAMKSALGGAVLEVTHRCEKRVGYLALIANVATLLGLLGTISGLIKTFASIANADPAEKAKLLGLGISEAMYCTAAGLLVGITAMVLHAVCNSKAESIVGDVQDSGLKLITWIEQSERVKQ
jgi:biopolymer transport protein ExbB